MTSSGRRSSTVRKDAEGPTGRADRHLAGCLTARAKEIRDTLARGEEEGLCGDNATYADRPWHARERVGTAGAE
jgi:hypothetical protein